MSGGGVGFEVAIMVATLVLVLIVLLCQVEDSWMYLRVVGDKVVRWEE